VDDLKVRAASTDQERRARLDRRLRAAFLEGAGRLASTARGLTAEELERILWHCPGDVAERREPDRSA
jgi:hypothetical protein